MKLIKSFAILAVAVTASIFAVACANEAATELPTGRYTVRNIIVNGETMARHQFRYIVSEQLNSENQIPDEDEGEGEGEMPGIPPTLPNSIVSFNDGEDGQNQPYNKTVDGVVSRFFDQYFSVGDVVTTWRVPTFSQGGSMTPVWAVRGEISIARNGDISFTDEETNPYIPLGQFEASPLIATTFRVVSGNIHLTAQTQFGVVTLVFGRTPTIS